MNFTIFCYSIFYFFIFFWKLFFKRSHVACLNFKTSGVGVYKCLSLIVGFAVTVAIWPREVVSCRDFILRAVILFGSCRLLELTLAGPVLTTTFTHTQDP